mmetsp:Transcript_42866/g.100547  ORF Transcript_42866/g.100547 Transcript_42866/m.100547 type:complete len:875 (-) Transcript_42866:245-2869(-)
MPAPWGLVPPEWPKRKPDPPVPIQDRAITLQQIRELSAFVQRLCKTGLLRYPNKEPYQCRELVNLPVPWSQVSMYEINDQLIKKVIPKACSCSWVELVGRGRKQPRKFFCSHNWGEHFRDFVATIQRHALKYKVPSSHSYWICVFANNQHNVELEDKLENSPFYVALNQSSMTVVMMDKNAEVLRRLWCVFEMNATCKLQKSFEFWTPLGRVGSALVSSGPIVQALRNMNLREARASHKADHRRIINNIAGVDELRGTTVVEDGPCKGQRVLDPLEDHPAYEEGLMDMYDREFQALKDDILQASLHSFKPEQFRRPLYPTFNNDGWPLDVAEQIKPYWIPPVEQRGITLAQLRIFLEKVRSLLSRTRCQWSDKGKQGQPELPPKQIKWSPRDCQEAETEEPLNIFSLRDTFVKPMTATRRCSAVELLAGSEQPPDYFVLYHWTDPIKKTLAALDWHAEARGLPDTTPYFIQVLAYNQEEKTLKTELKQTGVPKAMRHAAGMAVILDENVEVLRRSWSIYEVWCSLRQGKSIDFLTSTGALATSHPFVDGGWEMGVFSSGVARRVLQVDVKNIKCKSKIDTERILEDIADMGSRDGRCNGHQNLNERIRETAAGPVLRQAALKGDHEILTEVRTACPKLGWGAAALKGNLGESALHIAAAAGHIQIVKELVEKHASVNVQDAEGEAPLHYAAFAGQAEATKRLLEARANPMLRSFHGETPLDICLQQPTYFIHKRANVVRDALRQKLESDGEYIERNFTKTKNELEGNQQPLVPAMAGDGDPGSPPPPGQCSDSRPQSQGFPSESRCEAEEDLLAQDDARDILMQVCSEQKPPIPVTDQLVQSFLADFTSGSSSMVSLRSLEATFPLPGTPIPEP